ncbi:chemotaxis protein CheD [Desulfonema limicola]|nr:chemotaxis protein CheD [Desulfonema limicola]
MRILEYQNSVQGIKRHVNIHIGEFHASSRPTVISTLLGSCVAVCLYDPITQIGGMNHILMPGKADMKRFDMAARYGINAMELLINKIMNLGGNRRSLVAKIFGGAKTIALISDNMSMGRKNIEFVKNFLKTESIKIISQDISGRRSRKIWFHTDTSEVFLRRGKPTIFNEVFDLEKQVQAKIRRNINKSGEITFFQ